MNPGPLDLIFTLALLFSSFQFSIQNEGWCYDSGGKECVHNLSDWGGDCLLGMHQSPINIDTKKVQKLRGKDVLKIKFSKEWCDLNPEFYLRNSQHSVELRLTPNTKSTNHTMSGDGFRGTYYFAQMHFHWSDHNDKGSEHTFNNKRQALEIHLVHLNTKQGVRGTPEATSNIAVLGILAHATPNHAPNPVLRPILDVLSQASRLKDSVVDDFKIPIRLLDFLPKDRTIYRYSGSLTTPPCSQAVVWSVFAKPIEISVSQLAEFRKFKTHAGLSMNNNFRPSNHSALHDRKVFQHKFLSNCDKGAQARQAQQIKVPQATKSYKNVRGHVMNFRKKVTG